MQTGLCDVYQECDTGAVNTNALSWWLVQGSKLVFDQHHEMFNDLCYLVLTQQLLTTDDGVVKTFLNKADSGAWHRLCPDVYNSKPWGSAILREDTVYDARRVWFQQTTNFVEQSETPSIP